MASGKYACVVDAHPRFHLEALRWFATLTRVAGVAAEDLVVLTVDATTSDALQYLQDTGVRIIPVDRFSERSPSSNRISGAKRVASEGYEGSVVLTDTDVVVLDDARQLPVPDGAVAMKPTELPNPPLRVLQTTFKAAGLELPELVDIELCPGEQTVSGCANGGLYLTSTPVLRALVDPWSDWANWLLQNPELLGEWSFHVDQVAMSLALEQSGIRVIRLDSHWNCPTHLSSLPMVDCPAVLHYHNRVDDTGLIRSVDVPSIDSSIGRANAAIRDIWNEAFPNATFWDCRYICNPSLGSGRGSRGRYLAGKRQLLAWLAETLRPRSTLDVGCGDGEATRGLSLGQYVGLDVSEQALELAKQGRPDGVYYLITPDLRFKRSELVLCLDVLIHQPDYQSYLELVRNVVFASEQAVLISGYETRPLEDSPTIYFHEPLSFTLKQINPNLRLHAIRHAHEITTYLVRRRRWTPRWLRRLTPRKRRRLAPG
jgi:SAM-dependent methyltransferase